MSEQIATKFIEDIYRKPLPNNPNVRYGTALSPAELRLYAVGMSPELRNLEFQSGNLTEETYKRILEKLPELQAKVDVYNVAPISYTLQEREPEIYKRMLEDQVSAQQRQIDAGVRGNFPTEFTPFETKPPVGFSRRQKIASYGIDPDNPYVFPDRETEKSFYNHLAFTSRTPSKEQIKFITDKLGIKGDLQYLDNENPYEGFRFKAEGNDFYQILRNPRLTRDDIRKTFFQEGPAIVGDILGTVGTMPKTASKSIFGGLGTIALTAAGSGAGATAGDAVRLIIGSEAGLNNLTIEEIAKQSGMTGAVAFGGTAVVNSLMKILPALYRTAAGTQVPADVMEKIRTILNRQAQDDILRPDIIYGRGQKSVDLINEQIDRFAKNFKDKYRQYNPTLAGRNPLDQDAADLEFIFLEGATDPTLKEMYSAIRDGNQAVISNMMRALGKEFEEGVIPLGKEVDANIVKAAEDRIQDYINIGGAKINALIREAQKEIPTPTNTLFDNVIREEGSTLMLPKEVIRAQQIKENFLKNATDNFNTVINRPEYNTFVTGGGYTRNTINNYKKLQDNAELIVGGKRALREIEEVLGGKDSELIYRLAGRTPDGKKLGTKEEIGFTIAELFNIQRAMNELASSSQYGNVTNIATDLVNDIGRSIDKAFSDDVWLKLGNAKPKAKYSVDDINQIRIYQKANGLDELRAAYTEMSAAYQLSRNSILKQIIQSKPERLIPTILNTSSQGAATNSVLSDLFTVLKSEGSDNIRYVQREFFDYINRNVIDPEDSLLKQNKKLRDFVKKHEGTINVIFDDLTPGVGTRPKLLKINQLKDLEKEFLETDLRISRLKNTFGVGDTSVNPVYDIVTNIIRAGEQRRVTGALKNDIDFLLETIKGNKVLEEQIPQITKNILLRDILELVPAEDGMFRLSANKLNRLLNEGFGPDELSAQSFNDVFGPLLGKNADETIEAIRLINTMAQREALVPARVGPQEIFTALPGFKFLQRMIIPPLTQVGRRTTALDVLMNKRSEAFIGQMILDPELAKRVVATYEGRLSLQSLASFLSAYAITTGQTSYMNDIADELRYYDSVMKELDLPADKNITAEIEQRINNIVDNYQ